MTSPNVMQTRVRTAGVLVVLGLVVEGLSLRWAYPSAFFVFALVGFPMVLLGILLFLYSLVSVKGRDSD